MDYLIWWMTLLLIGGCQISGSKEILDFLVVYRTPFETSWPPRNYEEKIKEYHRWGNAKGFLLKNGDDYIDSVDGMVPLNCAPATASCQWKLSGSWKFVDVNITADQNFTINVGDEVEEEKDGCAKNNGGCRFICRNENGLPQCYCPGGRKIPANNMCYPINQGYQIIKTPILLENMYPDSKTWLVIPPKNATTFMTVSTPRYHRQPHQIYVQEVDGHQKKILLNLHEYGPSTRVIQSSHMLEVSITNAVLIMININFRRQHLALAQGYGSLNYDIFPVSNSICVSVVYTPKSNGAVKFNIKLTNGTKYEVTKYIERQFGEWKMRTFKSSFGNMTNDKVNMQIDVSGEGTTLHSVLGCNSYGQRDITVLENAVSIPETSVQIQKFKDASGKCFNGGVYNIKADMCVCPEGFAGERCEEGCGPHYFGYNCSSECSNFDTGCAGMMFCKKYLPCLCASGFQGKFCEKHCDSGFYGPSCTQSCGDCKLGTGACDKFTGYCHNGCQPGLRRPFCRIPYKYSTVSPTITYQDINVVTVEINTDEVEGTGENEYYQIQYRKSEEFVWTELQPKKIEDISITTNISDLLPGFNYKMRVVYIDKDGNSYQESEVPTTSFSSLCTVPTSVDYKLTATSTSSFSITLNWKYVTNKTECPITGYTIILQRNWNKVQQNVSGDQHQFSFNRLLPGVSYEVKIKANTQFGGGPFSSSLSVKTRDDAPLHVSDIRVTEADSRKLRLSWKPPRFTGGSLKKFVVKFQCTKLLACEEPYEEYSREITVPANQNHANLEDLLPHAQYLIEVAAVSELSGPYTSIEAVTQDSAPDAAPEMSATPIVNSTNTTLSVQWLPLKSCSFLNGYFVKYGYGLFSANGTVLATGNTTNTHVTFDDLTPQASYFIHIHVVSTGGWSKNKNLVINASTAATVPDLVQHMTIYKRGRRVIGVRWAQPVNTYGEIESFSVSHCQLNDCDNAVTVRIPPAPCVPWPTLFCHSISNLSPNKQYSVSVRARNVLVNEYGEAVTVNTVTSENGPEAPSSLRMTARTSDSITLEWKPPSMFNGILRSFLINIEQIDSANMSNCCVYSPLLEVPVKSEDEKYIHEVTDLMPSSKYIIGVSAKTIAIGPSTFLTVSTSPQITELIQPPELVENNRVKVPLIEGFLGVNGTYLLLVLLPNGNSTSLIWNPEVAEKLRNVVTTKSFYIVEEYNAEDLKSSMEETEFIEVEIGKGVTPRNGTIGVLEDPILPSNFSVGLALILDYNGALSVGFVSADKANEDDILEIPSILL